MAPSDTKSIVSEAQRAEERGMHREASALYASAAQEARREKRPRDAKSLLKKALELSPQSSRLYIQLALVENTIGNDDGAVRAMEKFTESTIQRSKIHEYRPYLEKHLASLPTLRQVFYRGLLQIDRTDAGPFLDYAQAAIDKSDWEDARDMLIDALKTKSRQSEVTGKLREVLQVLASTEALQAIDSFEAGRMPLKDLLVILRNKPKVAESTDDEEGKGVPEDENLDSLIERLEGEMGIEIQERHDNVRPLVNEFRRRSQSVLKHHTKTRMDLAMAFFEMGLVEDARDELKAVESTDPQFHQAQILIGEILYQEGSYLDALEVFQKCIRDDDAEAADDLRLEAAYKLVQTYERLGDDAHALKWATKVEEASPTYRDIRQLKRLIEERMKGKSSRD